jgi:putative ABC transport system substrate-binding protein
LGVVDSLAKRTEAITGITAMGYDLSSKRLQILKDVVPALSRVALVVNPKTRAPTENDIQKYGEAAKLLDVSVRVFDVDDYAGVAPTFAAITDWG